VIPVTWAVATDGGVSVGRTDRSVWDSSGTSAVERINFSNDGARFAAGFLGFALVDIFKTSDAIADGFLRNSRYGYTGLNADIEYPDSGKPYEIAYGDILAAGGDLLALIKENISDPSLSLINNITSDYQSGWLAGDIKGAWLADSDDTDVTGSELVTNGTFDSDTSGWTGESTAILTWSSGELNVDRNSGNSVGATQTVTTVIGKPYVLSVEAVSATNGIWINVTGGTQIDESSTPTLGVRTISFVATSTSTKIDLGVTGSTTGTANYDNVSVRLADIDRSVNGNGLQINGTITKTALGGDGSLVGYSGFSAANFFEQPYNSDLDFGTGDFYMMGWFKTNGATSSDRFVGRGSAADGNLLRVQTNTTTGYLATIINGITVTGVTDVTDNVWHHLMIARKSGAGYYRWRA